MAERLTEKYKDFRCPKCGEVISSAYDVEFYQSRLQTQPEIAKALAKLARYEDLEEQGRLTELPCAVGDTVYSFSFNIVYPFTVNGFEINKEGVEFKGSYCGEEKSLEYWSIRFPVSKIGKTVFLTPEEAEAALKGTDHVVR